MKILVIEDEVTLANAICKYIEEDGNICEVATDFESAWLKSGVYEYDCILVDLTLPGGNGLDLIRELKKQHSKAGIIIISAKNSLEDKIHGLELGSDDYLPKPFHLSELNARIKALVRRRNFQGENSILFNELTVLIEGNQLLVNQEPVDLTKSEYELLMYFLSNKNRVLSKENIAEHLVGDHADMMNSFDFIYSHVKNLRRKMVKAGSQDYIKAVYGIGYKFSV